MFRSMLKISILALALPLSTLAANHGHLLNRHHADLAKRVDEKANVTLDRRQADSKWTFYDVETGQAGSCGIPHRNSDFTVAVSAANMNRDLCFKRIRMTFNGRTTEADISDTCPGCPPNGLDLTMGLFSFFASHDAGIIYGHWELADAAPPPPPPPPPTPPPYIPPYTPPPPPSTTSSAAPLPTSTLTSSQSSSSSLAINSTSSSINYSSGPASGLAVPTGTSTPTSNTNTLEGMNQAFVQLGGLTVAGKLSA